MGVVEGFKRHERRNELATQRQEDDPGRREHIKSPHNPKQSRLGYQAEHTAHNIKILLEKAGKPLGPGGSCHNAALPHTDSSLGHCPCYFPLASLSLLPLLAAPCTNRHRTEWCRGLCIRLPDSSCCILLKWPAACLVAAGYLDLISLSWGNDLDAALYKRLSLQVLTLSLPSRLAPGEQTGADWAHEGEGRTTQLLPAVGCSG